MNRLQRMVLSSQEMSYNPFRPPPPLFDSSCHPPCFSAQVEIYWHRKLTPTWYRLQFCSWSALHVLTDVSQHRLRQGQIPADWSDRVRTSTSSWETNSIQAEVTWPGLRPAARGQQSGVSRCLSLLTIGLLWYSGLLWEALRSCQYF